jgi:hypothetical protein
MISVSISGVLSEIQTEYLPSIYLERYRYTNLLDVNFRFPSYWEHWSQV